MCGAKVRVWLLTEQSLSCLIVLFFSRHRQNKTGHYCSPIKRLNNMDKSRLRQQSWRHKVSFKYWEGLSAPLFLFKNISCKRHTSLFILTHTRNFLCFLWKSADHVKEIRKKPREKSLCQLSEVPLFWLTVVEYPLVVVKVKVTSAWICLLEPLTVPLYQSTAAVNRSPATGCDCRTQMGWVVSRGRGLGSFLWDAQGVHRIPLSPHHSSHQTLERESRTTTF